LTLPLLRQLTAELEVPRQTALGDMRSLIEAVISKGGHEPQNVQVLIQDIGDASWQNGWNREQRRLDWRLGQWGEWR